MLHFDLLCCIKSYNVSVTHLMTTCLCGVTVLFVEEYQVCFLQKSVMFNKEKGLLLKIIVHFIFPLWQKQIFNSNGLILINNLNEKI